MAVMTFTEKWTPSIYVLWAHCHVQETILIQSVSWHIIPLEAAIRIWVHCGYIGMDLVTNSTQVGDGI